jgi:hypothetical protein
MVAGGVNGTAGATNSTAIGTNVWIASSASNAVAVSAYTSTSSKSCATTKPGSLTLCADNKVTIEGSALVVNGVDRSALVVNDVDVLTTTSNLQAELADTKADFQVQQAELATTKAELNKTKTDLAGQKTALDTLKAKVAALEKKAQSATSPASGSLVGTLLALSLTAAALA